MSASILHDPATDQDPHLTTESGPQPLTPTTPAPISTFSELYRDPSSLPSDVKQNLIGGTSVLTLGIVIERGTGFLANILAARFGGAGTFGAYSLAISTANQISTYAAGGIGATAARFSGKYTYGSSGYSTLGRALAIISLVSAMLAAASLWLGAAPIAHLLGKVEFTGLLRWAALSAAGIILLECARGFFVGQRRLAALLLLSVIVGGGMLILLPAAAHMHSPVRMIVFQGLITTSAVAVCLLFAKPLGLRTPAPARSNEDSKPLPLRPMLRTIWSFGFVQLAGLIASNLTGWWLTTLVARADTTLVQMSFFAIASQLRNLVGMAPGLLTEGSYAVMADPGGEAARTPHRVMALCTYASIVVAFVLASTGIVFVPWAIRLLYGSSYQAAALTVAIGLAIAVVHMGNAPAAARLTIVSIRSTGIINTVWAVFVAAAASIFLFHGGSAWQAMAIYFVGHILSSSLVLLTLHRKDYVPAGMNALFLLTTATTTILAVLAFFRGFRPNLAAHLTVAMLIVLITTLTALYLLGERYGLLPSRAALDGLTDSARYRLNRRARHV